RVSLGEADAGIVYTTDVKAGGATVAGVDIPADQNVIAAYPMVRVKGTRNPTTATAFIDWVVGAMGQKVLAEYGFTEPSGYMPCPSSACSWRFSGHSLYPSLRCRWSGCWRGLPGRVPGPT